MKNGNRTEVDLDPYKSDFPKEMIDEAIANHILDDIENPDRPHPKGIMELVNAKQP